MGCIWGVEWKNQCNFLIWFGTVGKQVWVIHKLTCGQPCKLLINSVYKSIRMCTSSGDSLYHMHSFHCLFIKKSWSTLLSGLMFTRRGGTILRRLQGWGWWIWFLWWEIYAAKYPTSQWHVPICTLFEGCIDCPEHTMPAMPEMSGGCVEHKVFMIEGIILTVIGKAV